MILPKDIYEAQKNYIETVKKPFTMSVRDFVKRIRQMASYLPDFPRPIEGKRLQLNAGGTAAQAEKDIEFRSD